MSNPTRQPGDSWVVLSRYTNTAEEQIDVQHKLIGLLNEDEDDEDAEAAEAREEEITLLEEEMFEKEDEKSKCRTLAMDYAQQVGSFINQAESKREENFRSSSPPGTALGVPLPVVCVEAGWSDSSAEITSRR